ncbi:MAG: transcriptional repressor [Deltaproteobacteria bacterium]|nr:transcriptional repressor [Deltaproteobacteria bacterium]
MNIDSKIDYRETRQRHKIFEILCSTKSHPTADWIYERVKKEFPKLSLGTVYRNLKILKEQSKIQELPFGDTYDRFDGNALPHPHFVCRKCGAVCDIELDLPPISEASFKKYKIEGYSVTYYGVCEKCLTSPTLKHWRA